MKRKWLLLGVIVVLLGAAGASAFFLSAPSKPQFCWLFFGPKAELHVLVRLDGTVFFDRDGSDNLQRKDRLEECKNLVIHDPDGKTRYLVTLDEAQVVTPEKLLYITVDIKGPPEYRQGTVIWMAYEPTKASVAHFHGPLTIEPSDKKIERRRIKWQLDHYVLKRGDKSTELFANIGTTTTENGGCRVVVCTMNLDTKASLFPTGIQPAVDIEFPPKQAGEPPAKKRFLLDHVC
jgi:hypothetical protein